MLTASHLHSRHIDVRERYGGRIEHSLNSGGVIFNDHNQRSGSKKKRLRIVLCVKKQNNYNLHDFLKSKPT